MFILSSFSMNVDQSPEIYMVKNPQTSLCNTLDICNLIIFCILLQHILLFFYADNYLLKSYTDSKKQPLPVEERAGPWKELFLKFWKIILKIKDAVVIIVSIVILSIVSAIFIKLILYLIQVLFLRALKINFIFNSKFFNKHIKICMVLYGIIILLALYFLLTLTILLSCKDRNNISFISKDIYQLPMIISLENKKNYINGLDNYVAIRENINQIIEEVQKNYFDKKFVKLFQDLIDVHYIKEADGILQCKKKAIYKITELINLIERSQPLKIQILQYIKQILYDLTESIIMFFRSIFFGHLYNHIIKFWEHKHIYLNNFNTDMEAAKNPVLSQEQIEEKLKRENRWLVAEIFVQYKSWYKSLIIKSHDLLLGIVLPITFWCLFIMNSYYLYKMAILVEIKKQKKLDFSEKVLFVL